MAIKPMMLDLSPPQWQLADGGRRPSLDFKAELYSVKISLVTMNHAGVEHNCNIIRYGKNRRMASKVVILHNDRHFSSEREAQEYAMYIAKRVFRY